MINSDFWSQVLNLEQQLIERLQQLTPSHLEVVNESAGHGGYFPGKESHFKAIIVSEAFTGLRLVQRHQKVYGVAGDLLGAGKIHALAIHAFLPEEWAGQATPSPECAHAPKAEKVTMDTHLLIKIVHMTGATLACLAVLVRAFTLFQGVQGNQPNPVARKLFVALQHGAMTLIALTGIVLLWMKNFDVQPWFYAKVVLFLVLLSSLGKAYRKGDEILLVQRRAGLFLAVLSLVSIIGLVILKPNFG